MTEELKKYFISDARLSSYDNFEQYQTNIIQSSKYYTLLCIFEISLRNAIDNYMKYKISSQWLDDDFLHNDTKSKIQEAKKKIAQRKEKITHDKIVAELSLGFWTSLFRKSYSNIMRVNDIKHIFPSLPPKQTILINRAILDKRLNHIRKFRNKVFHYEKIIDKPEYKNISNEILELLEYFDIEIKHLANTLKQKVQ